MVSYEGLMRKLSDRGLTKTAIAQELGISSRTVAKIGLVRYSAIAFC